MIYYSFIQLLIFYLYTAQTNDNIKIIKVVNVGMKLLLKLNHSECTGLTASKSTIWIYEWERDREQKKLNKNMKDSKISTKWILIGDSCKNFLVISLSLALASLNRNRLIWIYWAAIQVQFGEILSQNVSSEMKHNKLRNWKYSNETQHPFHAKLNKSKSVSGVLSVSHVQSLVGVYFFRIIICLFHLRTIFILNQVIHLQ